MHRDVRWYTFCNMTELSFRFSMARTRQRARTGHDEEDTDEEDTDEKDKKRMERAKIEVQKKASLTCTLCISTRCTHSNNYSIT